MRKSLRQMRAVMSYLPSGAKRYLAIYITISCLLSILDVAALMILAMSLSSMLAGSDINMPVVGTIGKDQYVLLLLGVSALIILKSILSLLQQWHATRRLASFELELGGRLFDAYLRAPWVERLSRSTSQIVRMADIGVAAVMSGLILPLIALPGVLVSSALILLALLVVQPLTAAITLAYLGLIAFLMSMVLTRKTVEAGRVNRDYSFKVAGLMTDMVGALKEVTLGNKVDEIAEVVAINRSHATRARANIQFLGSVPKFILDSALIGGFVLIGGTSYLASGSLDEAVSAVVLFAVGGMRLIPALTSLQSTNNQLNANSAQVDAVLMDMQQARGEYAKGENLGAGTLDKEPGSLSLENVSFTYPTGNQPAVANVSLTIDMGTSVGIVGESGSGKSTLVDMLLGLLEPQEGTIFVDDRPLTEVLGAWRSKVGYVPQEVSLFDGTIAQNVALSWKGSIDRGRVQECLERAQLWSAVQERPRGMDAQVGERGIALSGGQRQRLGIARALYSNPYVLILDEATSALDTKTESEVAKAITDLRGDLTIIAIAHRLSTVKGSDQLFYMEAGHVLAHGSFDEVVDSVPSFREQAQLAGLVAAPEAD